MLTSASIRTIRWLLMAAMVFLSSAELGWGQESDFSIPYSGIAVYPDCIDFTPPPPVVPLSSGPPDGTGGSINPFLADMTGWRWIFMPQGFLYHTYWASMAEPRLATQLFHENGQGELLDSTIGGRLGFVRFGRADSAHGFQLDVIAGAKLRQDPGSEMDMVGTDYRYDIPLTYRDGAHAWKFGFYHVSAHTGDEFLLKHPGFNRLNFYRDTLYLGYSYYVIPELRLYGETGWAFNSDISEPWEFQFGLDYGPAYPTGIRGAPFVALNAHLREELNFGGNFNMQFGWAWKMGGPNAGTLRTGGFYYNGGSPQFSFYQTSEQSLGWGLWYDF
jgi:hypothetical protein